MSKLARFIVLLACVMLLGLTQCKKELPEPQAESVRITLNIGDESKVAVTPGFTDPVTGQVYAKVEFKAGDRIYVGNNGKYCGYIDYDGETHQFTGTISPESQDDYLHFYFMGNKTPSASLETNTTTTFSVVLMHIASMVKVILLFILKMKSAMRDGQFCFRKTK